jgi:hypothetical protein
MPLDYTHLKVDQTLLRYNDQYLLVSNINIPESDFVRLDQVLARTQQLLALDYNGILNIQFQVCATYDLRNTSTGEIRHWNGSFNPKGNRYNSLCDFQPYLIGTFVNVVTRACHPDNVYNRLRFFHVETAWVFDRLTSAIISVQARIDPQHPTIERRQLLNRRNGRISRVQVTFLLP